MTLEQKRKTLEKTFKKVTHRMKVYPMVSKNTGVGYATINQKWLTKKGVGMKDEEIETHFDKVMEVFDVCLKFQEYEKKHYKTFG